MRKFELKKVKVHEDMSEETLCFSAELYEGDEHLATVSNRGIGGCNDFYRAEGIPYDRIRKYETMDMEVEIFEAVEEFLLLKKHQTKCFILKDKDGVFYTQKFPNGLTLSKLKKVKGYDGYIKVKLDSLKNEGYEVLNKNL